MHALRSLIREHQLISRLVDSLSVYAEALTRDDAADPADLARFARFFREFADQLHHEKEDRILLPMLVRHGFTWEEGVLADVRRDHDQERYLIDVLCQASERHDNWTEADRRSIAATAVALSNFELAHLTRENEELFPEMIRRLSDDVLTRLRAELERFDASAPHRALNLELIDVAMDLVARYAAPRTSSSSSTDNRPSSESARVIAS